MAGPSEVVVVPFMCVMELATRRTKIRILSKVRIATASYIWTYYSYSRSYAKLISW